MCSTSGVGVATTGDALPSGIMHACMHACILARTLAPACTPWAVTHPNDGRVAEASLDADDAACQHTAQAVGGEAAAENALDLVLQHKARLITAQVGHGCKHGQYKAALAAFEYICVVSRCTGEGAVGEEKRVTG
jgi:hypothetical protein